MGLMFDEKYRELFGDLPLEKPFFYNAAAALRFELGAPGQFREPDYMNQVYERAFKLFEEMFHPDDDVWIAAFAHRSPGRQKRTSVFRNYVKKPQWVVAEGRMWENDEGIVTDRFIGTGRVRDIHHRRLIRALSHLDMGLRPVVEESCFFIHPEKRIVYHLYDDRGLDIAAASAESLRPLYEAYNGWLLDYDRETMDQLFA